MTSEENKKLAEQKKEEANKLFAAKKYNQAVVLYTEAQELDPDNAVYYTNRAFCHFKLENYGAVIADGDVAVQKDPSFAKGYYRRGSGYFALGRFKLALKDFKTVVKLRPKDPDAQKKMKECEKAVKKEAFEKAIASEYTDTTPVSKKIKLDEIQVEESYKGVRFDEDITLDLTKELMDQFKDQKKLHRKYLLKLLLQARDILDSRETLMDVTIPDGEKITVCGDTHGQYYDLCRIFELNGLPSKENPYLFNGDFVDRGSFSIEVITLLLAFMVAEPECMYLTRGNHETVNMNKVYGFEGEAKAKYNEQTFALFSEIFCLLPLCAVIEKKIFVVHGGLFSEDNVTLDDIRKIDRKSEPPANEMLWSDPQKGDGRAPSQRGVGVAFGPDVTKKFLDNNGLDLIIRSHEMKEAGYEVEADGRLITIFSAPNYVDQMGNKGAFITLQKSDLSPKFTQFEAAPHPNVKPMAYANTSMFGM